MPEIKAHLRDLHRVKTETSTRRGLLRLDMNESVTGLPEEFVKQVFTGLTPEFLATYPEYGSLQQKIALHNNIKPENICIANGSDAAIKYIFDAYVSPGDGVLITDPTFAMYPVYCSMFDARAVRATYTDNLAFPLEDFLFNLSAGVKLAVLVNPNNPTGSVLQRDDIVTLIEKAALHDVLLVVDEAYFYYYPESAIDMVARYDNLVVLRTFSKLCGIAAARIGYAAAGPAVIENLRRVKPTFDVNALAVLLAERILDDPGVLASMVRDMREGKRLLLEKLSEANISYRDGHANFVLIRCDERVGEVMNRLKEEGILVNGGFGQKFLKDYIRVTVGGPAAMERFFKTFLSILKGHDV